MKIFSSVKQTEEFIREYFGGSFDATIRMLKTPDGRMALVLAFDGMVDSDYIQAGILKPLMGMTCRLEKGRIINIDSVKDTFLLGFDVKIMDDMISVMDACTSGDTAIFLDDAAEAIVVQTRGWNRRGISEPQTDKSVRGPREAFTESLLLNTTMIRRKIKSHNLTLERTRIGAHTHTDVCLVYLKGVADETLLGRLRERLARVDVAYILESGHIEQLLEDHKHSVFSTVGNTEKPDVAAGRIIKGRVAIVVDGTPFVLTVPMLFSENFQSMEDYYSRKYYANIVRLLRVLSYFIATTLPALYVALLTYHQEMIPGKLLAMMIRASEGTVFSTAVEMFILLIIYGVLRESLLRLPDPLGATVGIIGSFVIGDAAVAAGIIGAPTVVVMALTFVCSAVVNSASDSTAVLRLLYLIAAAVFGIFGVMIAILATAAHLCSIKSFGVPYMMPLAPVKKRALKDSIVRGDIEGILKKDGL